MLPPRNKLAIEDIIERQARRDQAKIHGQQNVGNHLHLMVSFRTKEQFIRFLRSISGLIASHVLQARKGKPAGGKFWDQIPFTRIIQGFCDFNNMLRYILKNVVEVEIGTDFREGIERFERALAKSRKTGRHVSEFL